MRRPVDDPIRITGDRASHAEYGVGPASDYACPLGTPILAPFAGDLSTYVTTEGGLGVILRGTDATFYGQHLWVRMPAGWYAEGARIALSGNSGTQTTGPHLHCYVIVHATGERLSMEEYLQRGARPAGSESDMANSDDILNSVREVYGRQEQINARAERIYESLSKTLGDALGDTLASVRETYNRQEQINARNEQITTQTHKVLANLTAAVEALTKQLAAPGTRS